jgi:hypothetical protein
MHRTPTHLPLSACLSNPLQAVEKKNIPSAELKPLLSAHRRLIVKKICRR